MISIAKGTITFRYKRKYQDKTGSQIGRITEARINRVLIRDSKEMLGRRGRSNKIILTEW
jgi:hypothetical protein